MYRKSHIPDAVGYQEKFCFSPGDSRDAFQLIQSGHAVANSVPLVVANRIGLEAAPAQASGESGDEADGGEIGTRFHGSSFIAGSDGALLAAASQDHEEVVTASVGPARTMNASAALEADRVGARGGEGESLSSTVLACADVA